MAYDGKSPDQDWTQMNPRTTEPTFPSGATDAYKEGTFFVSNETSATGTFYPPGFYVYLRDSTGAFNWQILTPNTNATLINAGNLGAEYGGVPCGTILPFAKDVSSTGLPTGYLLCDGSAISQTTYATLYAVVGVAFGDGTTGTGGGTGKFNLPDFRGRFLRGMAHGSTNDPDSGTRTADYTGGATGDNVGSYQADAFQDHRHNLTLNGYEQAYGQGAGGWSAEPHVHYSGMNKPSDDGGYTASTVGGAAVVSAETRPKNIYVDYIIRYL